MQALHHTFTSHQQALESYNLMRKRGFQVSQPFQDQHGTWCITHLVWG